MSCVAARAIGPPVRRGRAPPECQWGAPLCRSRAAAGQIISRRSTLSIKWRLLMRVAPSARVVSGSTSRAGGLPVPQVTPRGMLQIVTLLYCTTRAHTQRCAVRGSVDAAQSHRICAGGRSIASCLSWWLTCACRLGPTTSSTSCRPPPGPPSTGYSWARATPAPRCTSTPC